MTLDDVARLRAELIIVRFRMDAPNEGFGWCDEGRTLILAERTRNQIERDSDEAWHINGNLMIHLDGVLSELSRSHFDLLMFVIFAEEIIPLPTANASLVDGIIGDAIDQIAEVEERSHVRAIRGSSVADIVGEAHGNLKCALRTQHVLTTDHEIILELRFESFGQQIEGSFGV
jgi:hypothetical protein